MAKCIYYAINNSRRSHYQDMRTSRLGTQGDLSDRGELVTGRWFSLGPPASSTNITDRHDITEKNIQ
jgi:hypothetical protein